jgi:hypothetical protein
VKVGDLYEALKAEGHDVSLEDFHRQLLRWRRDGKVVVGKVNDPRLEPPESLGKMLTTKDRSFGGKSTAVLGYITAVRPPASEAPIAAADGPRGRQGP